MASFLFARGRPFQVSPDENLTAGQGEPALSHAKGFRASGSGFGGLCCHREPIPCEAIPVYIKANKASPRGTQGLTG